MDHTATLTAGALRAGMSDVRTMVPTDAPLWWSGRHITSAIRGRIPVGDKVVSLRIGASERFPKAPPEIAWETVETSPHVSPHDGTICFASRESLFLQEDDPVGIVAECIELAWETLQKPQGPEFLAELSVHWARLPGARPALSAVTPGDEIRPVVALFDRHTLMAVADSQETLRSARVPASRWTTRKALYVPVDSINHETFQPQQLLAPTTWAIGPLVNTHLSGHEGVVVLGVRRHNGPRVLVAAHLRAKHMKELNLADNSDVAVTPIPLERCDRTYLAPRGGANEALSSKRTAIIGCGAVGGFVAMGLARAGFGRLALFDDDSFGFENAYRHVTGVSRVRKKKVEGLKEEILRATPHVIVDARDTRLEDLLRREPQHFEKYDLVVCATGVPNLALQAFVWVRTVDAEDKRRVAPPSRALAAVVDGRIRIEFRGVAS